MQHTARTRTAADDLKVVVNHWPHLRALLDTSNPTTWPPAMGTAEYLRTLDEHDRDETVLALAHVQQLVTRYDAHGRVQYECLHCDYVGEGRGHLPRTDRDALQLGERPVPLRLHVVDACRAVEVALCSIADEVAAEVQLAPIPSSVARRADYRTAREAQIAAADRARRDELAADDAASPNRWSFTMGDRSAVRAAEWLLARLGDDPYCKPITDIQRERITLVAREAARRIERTIGGVDERHSVAMGDDRPCPWCKGELTLHRGGGEPDTVTCATGFACTAPVPVDSGRRRWSTPEDLAGLQVALDTAERRRKRAEDRRRQRAAARTRQDTAA